MAPEIVTLQSQSTAIPDRLSERLHGFALRPPLRSNGSSTVVGAIRGGQERHLRYQHGHLYEDHGSWFVQYRQKDDSGNVRKASKHLGRSKDFFDTSEVEQCRTRFMQAVNRDRLCLNSRITLTAFAEGAYLPWTKEDRRASTSKGHHEIWRNYLRERIGDIRLREFRTVEANRLLRAIAPCARTAASLSSHR